MKASAAKKFSTSHSSPLPPNEPGAPKKSVAGPTSPLHFMDLLLFSTLRRPMSLDPTIKAGIYLSLAAAVSLIFDFIKPPPTYFSNKHNPFNQIFVKLGWGWTCGSLAAFLVASSFVYTIGNVKLMRAHVIRLIVGSGCWYTVTGFINLIHDWSGQCLPLTIVEANKNRPSNRLTCHRAGGLWSGFDISGHCFLLVMANLWILEELKCMQYWSKLSEIIHSNGQNNYIIKKLTEKELSSVRSSFKRLSFIIRVIFIFVSCLSMLWDIMFITTVIYFHTMPSKLIGTVIGVACWFMFYRVIFPLFATGSWGGMAPGLPGDGPIKFVSR